MDKGFQKLVESLEESARVLLQHPTTQLNELELALKVLRMIDEWKRAERSATYGSGS